MKTLNKYFWGTNLVIFILAIGTLLFHPHYGGPLSSFMSADNELEDLGKKLYITKKCYACHGDKGKKPITPSYPIINAQNYLYLQAQITDIMKGYRTNGMSSQMKSAVGSLTDDEIVALSTYLNKVK